MCAPAAGAAVFLIPAASLGLAFPVLLAYRICYGLSGTVWMIAMTTTQQLVTPEGVQGRVAGFVQAALLATVPVGAPAGGAPAAWLGNVPVLLGSAAVALLGGVAGGAVGARAGGRERRRRPASTGTVPAALVGGRHLGERGRVIVAVGPGDGRRRTG